MKHPTLNIRHSTFNAAPSVGAGVECWMFNVGCWTLSVPPQGASRPSRRGVIGRAFPLSSRCEGSHESAGETTRAMQGSLRFGNGRNAVHIRIFSCVWHRRTTRDPITQLASRHDERCVTPSRNLCLGMTNGASRHDEWCVTPSRNLRLGMTNGASRHDERCVTPSRNLRLGMTTGASRHEERCGTPSRNLRLGMTNGASRHEERCTPLGRWPADSGRRAAPSAIRNPQSAIR